MAFRLTWNMCKASPASRAKAESHLHHHTMFASSSYFRRNLEATKIHYLPCNHYAIAYAVQTLQPCCVCSSWDLKSLFLLQSEFTRTMAQNMSLYYRSASVSLDIMTPPPPPLIFLSSQQRIGCITYFFPISTWSPFQFSFSDCILLIYNTIILDWARKVNFFEGFLIRVGF